MDHNGFFATVWLLVILGCITLAMLITGMGYAGYKYYQLTSFINTAFNPPTVKPTADQELAERVKELQKVLAK